MVTVEIVLCGRDLGKHGSCDNVSGHSGSCSSPELKAYRRTATAASRARAKKETDGDSIIEKCACGHTLTTCPNPKYCGLSRTQIEEKRQREAAEAREAEAKQAARLRKVQEEQFLTEVLDRHAQGEAIDHQTQESFLATVISYLGVEAKKFRLSREERIARGFNTDGIGESYLSEALYGPSYTGLYEPIAELDERSFPVRLGRFLNVPDIHGSLNTPSHPDMKRKKDDVPVPLPLLGLPPVFTPGPPPGL